MQGKGLLNQLIVSNRFLFQRRDCIQPAVPAPGGRAGLRGASVVGAACVCLWSGGLAGDAGGAPAVTPDVRPCTCAEVCLVRVKPSRFIFFMSQSLILTSREGRRGENSPSSTESGGCLRS